MSINLAHGSIEGIGDLWNGLLHPLRSPAHLLILVALGLLAGQRQHLRAPVVCFVTVCGGTLILMGLLGSSPPPAWFLSGLSAVLGVLLAGALPITRLAQTLVFGIAGLTLAADSTPDDAHGWVLFKNLIGVWIGLAVLILNLANYGAMCPRKPWVTIAFRVLGSWIAAVSILSLALNLRK